MKTLTDRQANILRFIHTYTRESGFPPAILDIMDEFHLNSNRSCTVHTDALTRKGYLEFPGQYLRKARTFRVTAKGCRELGLPSNEPVQVFIWNHADWVVIAVASTVEEARQAEVDRLRGIVGLDSQNRARLIQEIAGDPDQVLTPPVSVVSTREDFREED